MRLCGRVVVFLLMLFGLFPFANFTQNGTFRSTRSTT
mgnify:CR=1 FL=1